MLGSDIENELKKNKIRYIASDVKSPPPHKTDITNNHSVRKMLKSNPIEWIINCAAYTQVDLAEKEEDLALKINAEGVKNLAKFAAEIKNIKIIHFSTDYVFDGKKKVPYVETDKPSPLSVYGRSKFLGEEFLRKYSNSFYIIRTAWLYGISGDNFVKKIISLMKSKNELKVVFFL